MAWDLKLDLETKDWVFSPNHDYVGVDANDLTKQRMMIRLFIERGSFIYDKLGNLGSRLSSLLALTSDDAQREAAIMVQEALAPMNDIEVLDVSIDPTDNGKMIILNIVFRQRPNSFLDTEIGQPLDDNQILSTFIITV